MGAPVVVQGMSDLAAPLLCVMRDEAEAFWCFACLMEKLEVGPAHKSPFHCYAVFKCSPVMQPALAWNPSYPSLPLLHGGSGVGCLQLAESSLQCLVMCGLSVA